MVATGNGWIWRPHDEQRLHRHASLDAFPSGQDKRSPLSCAADQHIIGQASWADGVMLGLIVVNQNCQNLKSVPFRAACCGIQAAVDVLKGKLVIGLVVNGFDGLHGVSQTIEASILSYSAWLRADPDR
jgi:hypothetical protein